MLCGRASFREDAREDAPDKAKTRVSCPCVLLAGATQVEPNLKRKMVSGSELESFPCVWPSGQSAAPMRSCANPSGGKGTSLRGPDAWSVEAARPDGGTSERTGKCGLPIVQNLRGHVGQSNPVAEQGLR